MTLDKSNTDKLAEFCNEARRLGVKRRAALDQALGRRFRGASGRRRRALRSAMRSARSRASARARRRRWSPRGANEPFRDLADFAGRIDPREVNKRMLESLAAAGAFDELEPDRARVVRRDRDDPRLRASARRGAPRRPERAVRRRGAEAHRRCRRSTALDARRAAAARVRLRSASFSPAIRSTPMPAILSRLRVQRWADFARAVKQGASAGRLAATVLDRHERRTKSGSQNGHRAALRSVRPI